MITFTECFDIILTGDKDASRRASRQVRKTLYSFGSDSQEKFEMIKIIINRASEDYFKIKEDWRQENFVMAISVIYFLRDSEQPDFLFPWLFDLLQHANGYIRYAAVRMFENELGPLTAHLRFPQQFFTPERQEFYEKAEVILYELYINLIDLISDLWKPVYKRHKYISSLPSGPYKSVQMLIASLEEDCGKDFVNLLQGIYAKTKDGKI